VARRFAEWVPAYANASEPIKISLAGVNAMQLALAGVRDIWAAGECTYCHPERYFSFRREEDEAGRMTSFIGLV
jgi:copper oxidase (laccase) domain-containing protein